jgi:hypothetical protein
VIFDPACSTQSLFVHPTSLLIVQRQVIAMGFLIWGGEYSQHRKIPEFVVLRNT